MGKSKSAAKRTRERGFTILLRGMKGHLTRFRGSEDFSKGEKKYLADSSLDFGNSDVSEAEFSSRDKRKTFETAR